MTIVPLQALAEESCPAGNLLKGAEPERSYETYQPQRITDERLSEEGGPRMSHLAANLFTGDARAVYRLRQPTRIRSLLLQADGAAGFSVDASMDGESWVPLWDAAPTGEPGVRTRQLSDLDREALFLRIAAQGGAGFYSVVELAAYCRRPEPWPPRFDTEPGVVMDDAWFWSRETRLAHFKIAVGVFGGLIFYVTLLVRRQGGEWAPWLWKGLLVGVGVLGAWSWTNFGSFHGANVIHFHDGFHYFMGSKYFDENRYARLYHCTVVAEEELGRGAALRSWKVRNLVDNRLVPAQEILDERRVCREAFGPERWDEFKADVAFFRTRLTPQSWERIFRDHGYNATPVWNLFGSRLCDRGPASRTLAALTLIDPLLYAGLFALILWAFGLEAFSLALLVFGVGFPWHYNWTGGAIGRAAWLFLAVAALCLLKKRWFASGGFALAASALLRIFPGLLIGGLLVLFGYNWLEKRRVEPSHRRMLAGALLALATLIPASLLADGVRAWPEMLTNSIKHQQTPLTNHMGLQTLFSWHPDAIARKMALRFDDPSPPWEEGRRRTFASRSIYYWPTAVGLLVLVGLFALRRAEGDWEVVAAGVLSIVALVELTSYYYSFLLLLVPLALKRPRHAAVLLVAAIVSRHLQLYGGLRDTQFLLVSLLFLLVPTYLLVDRLLERPAKTAT